jgi:hypothetical protein
MGKYCLVLQNILSPSSGCLVLYHVDVNLLEKKVMCWVYGTVGQNLPITALEEGERKGWNKFQEWPFYRSTEGMCRLMDM